MAHAEWRYTAIFASRLSCLYRGYDESEWRVVRLQILTFSSLFLSFEVLPVGDLMLHPLVLD